MGGCYSSDSQGALASPRHKLPRDKPSRRSSKKEARNSPATPTTNGGNTHHHQYNDHLITPSTKVPLLAEPEAEPEPGTHENSVPPRPLVISNEDGTKGVAPSDSGIESLGSPQEEVTPVPEAELVSSDKDFTLCKCCQHRLQRLSRSACQSCGNFRLDTSELSAMVNGDTYCTCGPRQPGKQAAACRTHGVRGGGGGGGSNNNHKASPAHRHSDLPSGLLQASLKQQLGLGRGASTNSNGHKKRVRLSWKSADSLDMDSSAMNTSMDRCQSEASDVFGDDISFRAPLAQFDSLAKFDSVEHHLDREEKRGGGGGGERCDAPAFLASRMSIYSEILDLTDSICKCDFAAVSSSSCPNPSTAVNFSGSPAVSKPVDIPGVVASTRSGVASSSSPRRKPPENVRLCLAEEDDEDSGNGMSKSDDRSGSATDSELEEVGEGDEGRSLSMSSHSSPLRFATADVLESLPNPRGLEEPMCPVSVTVKGRQMVMMEASTYQQMINDLALLKEQLTLLTEVIQQEEEGVGVLNLSMDLDS